MLAGAQTSHLSPFHGSTSEEIEPTSSTPFQQIMKMTALHYSSRASRPQRSRLGTCMFCDLPPSSRLSKFLSYPISSWRRETMWCLLHIVEGVLQGCKALSERHLVLFLLRVWDFGVLLEFLAANCGLISTFLSSLKHYKYLSCAKLDVSRNLRRLLGLCRQIRNTM